jgi:uncharacterized protein YndB with AHSA1/START domain
MPELFVRESVEINASAARVFDVLVNPNFTKQYMFGCEAVSDWKVGSPLLWKGQLDGKEVVFVKGNVLRIEPARVLEFTTFDPNMGIEDVPANYLTASYRLSPKNDGVLLEVSQGDYALVANSEERYQHTVGGWGPLLSKIKTLAEQS